MLNDELINNDKLRERILNLEYKKDEIIKWNICLENYEKKSLERQNKERYEIDSIEIGLFGFVKNIVYRKK